MRLGPRMRECDATNVSPFLAGFPVEGSLFPWTGCGCAWDTRSRPLSGAGVRLGWCAAEVPVCLLLWYHRAPPRYHVAALVSCLLCERHHDFRTPHGCLCRPGALSPAACTISASRPINLARAALDKRLACAEEGCGVCGCCGCGDDATVVSRLAC